MSSRAIAFRLSLLYGLLFLSIGIFMPYWPVWLRDQGLEPGELGVLLAMSYFIRTLANPYVGSMVDRRGDRRRAMVVLAAGSFCFYTLFLFVDGFWPFLALTVLAGACFTSIMPLGDNLAMLQASERRLDYGRIRMWGSLTFIVASTLGGMVLERGSSNTLLWLMLASLLVLVGGCALVPDLPSGAPGAPGPSARDARAGQPADRRDEHTPAPRASLRRLLVQPIFLLFLITVSLVQSSHMVYYGFGTLHWQAAGLSGDTIGLLWAEGVLAEVALFIFSGALLRRLGPVRLLVLAGLAAAVRWTVLGMSVAPLALVMVQGLHAFTFGACHIGAMHFITRAAPRSLSAGAQSLYASIATGLCSGLAMLAAGPLYGALGGAAFHVSALVALVGAALAVLLGRRWDGGELIC